MSKLKYQSLLDNGFVLSDDKPKPDWNATSGEDAEILNKPDLSIYSKNANLGNILFVSANAPIANDGNTREQVIGRINKPFKSIQSAVNVALTNDVIIIFSGTYNENIVNNDFLFETRNLKFVGLGNVNITSISFTQNSHFDFENVNFTNFITFSGPGAGQTIQKLNKCNITTQTLGCSGQYLFENCNIGRNGSINQGAYGSSTFKYKNSVLNDLFYYYNNDYGMRINNKLIFDNCEIKKIELTGDVLTPILVLFEKCKFVSQTSFNLVSWSINLSNLFLLNCVSNKPIHPNITNIINYYQNILIE